MTNGDRIRQMSNEELAEYIETKIGYTNCKICIYRGDGLCCVKCIEGIKAYLEMEEE